MRGSSGRWSGCTTRRGLWSAGWMRSQSRGTTSPSTRCGAGLSPFCEGTKESRRSPTSAHIEGPRCCRASVGTPRRWGWSARTTPGPMTSTVGSSGPRGCRRPATLTRIRFGSPRFGLRCSTASSLCAAPRRRRRCGRCSATSRSSSRPGLVRRAPFQGWSARGGPRKRLIPVELRRPGGGPLAATEVDVVAGIRAVPTSRKVGRLRSVVSGDGDDGVVHALTLLRLAPVANGATFEAADTEGNPLVATPTPPPWMDIASLAPPDDR
mmetsp:Transcript_463/g.1314  ORF Transcript_463/g.1314 Transcript_463/m.1314 type:complete len:267 (-) Transcript_463:121-921(-)